MHIQQYVIRLGLEVLPDDRAHLALPPAVVPPLHAHDLQTARAAAPPAAQVPQPPALGENALAQGVDMAVGRLPQAQDGLVGGVADEGDVGRGRRDQAGGDGGHRERRGELLAGRRGDAVKEKNGKKDYTRWEVQDSLKNK